MKKRIVLSTIVALLLVVGLILSANPGIQAQSTTIKVGATPNPHGEILSILVPVLAEQDINLQVIEFTDYVRPNLALQDGDIDANYFQHLPYLESFNNDRGTDLVALTGVHIEPMGAYSDKVESLEELQNRAQIAIPNDPTNGGRALLLLQTAGLIKVDPSAGITPSIFDITENPLNIIIHELEAAQLPRVLDDVDIAVINGNYALEADLIPTEDAILLEDAESPYVNILAVQEENADDPALLKLAEALNSDIVKDFILENYPNSVVPTF